MADGTVKIDITADASKATKSVEQLNKSIDGAFQDKSGRWRAASGRFLTMKEQSDMLGTSLDDMGNKGGSASLGIGKIVTALGLVKLASGAIDLLKSSLDGAIERYDTMNNFPRIMEQLGFSTDESTAAIDKLSDGVSGLPTPLNEIVKSAQGIALMTGDLDGATDTALALNNAFLASGSSAGDTSRGMQQYVQMLSRGEVDMMSWRTLQETMGVALNDTAKAFGFAGKSAQTDLYDALQDGSITFDEFNAKIVELDGGVNGFSVRAKTASAGIKTAFANMRTAVVRGLEGVIRSIDDALASNGLPSIQQMIEAVGTAFETVLGKIASVIPPVIGFIGNMVKVLKPFAPIILGVVAAAVTFGTVIGVIAGVSKSIGMLKLAFSLLGKTILANPIVAIVAVLIGLGVAFYKAYKSSETFRNGVNKVLDPLKKMLPSVEQVKSGISKLVEGFKNFISPLKEVGGSIDFVKIGLTLFKLAVGALLGPIGLVIKIVAMMAKAIGGGDIQAGIQKILDGFSGLASGVKEAGGQVGSSVGDMLAGILTAIGAALPGIIAGALSIIAGFISGLAQGLPQVALAAAQLILAFAASMLLLIPTIAASATLLIVALLGSLANGLPLIILAGINLIVSLVAGLTAGIPQFVIAITNLIVVFLASVTANLPRILLAGTNLLIAFLQGLIDNLPKIVETVGTLITTFLDAITEKLPSIITSGTNLLVAWLQGIANNLPDVITAAVDVIVAFINGIANELPRIIASAVNLIVAFLQGIADSIPKIVSAAWDVVDALVQGLLDSQDRLFNAMIELMNGLARNINDSAPKMKTAAAGLLTAMIGALPGGGLLNAGLALAGGLLSGLSSGFEKVKSTVSGWATWIKDHKGPISYDKRLLVEAGNAIVYGLNAGLTDSFSSVENTVKNMAESINDMFSKKIDISPIEMDAKGTRNLVTKMSLENDMASQLMMPKLTAESAMGIGNRMSTSPSSLMNATKNTTVTNDNGMAIHIGNIENNSDSDIPKILEEAAWIMSRDKRRLGYE